MTQTGVAKTFPQLATEVLTDLASGQVPPISANTARQVLLDSISTQVVNTCDPWQPPPVSIARDSRQLVTDYTFGTAASPVLAGAQPITNLTLLDSLFWNLLPFTQPATATNGTGTRYHQEWQTYVGSANTNTSFNATDLQMQCRLNPLVTTDTSVANLQKLSITPVTIPGPGTYTFNLLNLDLTPATGMDWLAGDPINIADHAFGNGTLTSYNSSNGQVVINLTTVNFPGGGGATGDPWYITRAYITAAMIRSKNTFLYGFIEGSIWTPPGAGFIPQYWNFPDDGSAHGGTESEIDFFEQLCGNTARGLDGTYSWCSARQNNIGDLLFTTDDVYPYFDIRNSNQMNGGSFSRGPLIWHHPNFDVTTGFHKYQCLWVPGYAFIYIDDQPVVCFRMTWKTAQGYLSDFAWFILNFAVGISGDNFAGRPNSVAQFPANLRCQYIRIYQSPVEQAFTAYLRQQLTFNLFSGGVGLTSAWTIPNVPSVILTTGAALDSNGTFQAARLTEATGGSFWQLEQNVTIQASQTYTFSLKIKVGSSGTRNVAVRHFTNTFADFVTGIFSTATGQLVFQDSGGAGVFIASSGASPNNLGNGWFQVWITGTLGTNTFLSELITVCAGTQTFYDPAANGGIANVLVFDPHLIIGTAP